MDGAALATVADSFAAIEQRVVDEKRLTFDELNTVIQSNFEGVEGEYIRRMLQHSERYCQGNSRGRPLGGARFQRVLCAGSRTE